MSKYTSTLKNLSYLYGKDTILSWFKDYQLTDYLTNEEIEVITTRGTWTKEKLANKIYNHYLMREIGFETGALFKHYVKVTMEELMEEYLPLIYSSSIKYDPMVNVDYREIYEGTTETNGSLENNSEGESEVNNTGSGLNVNSGTPQGQISKQAILQGNWANSTQANEDTNQQTSSGSNSQTSISEGSSEQNYTKHIIGNSGVSATAQAMIKQYRENIIAIDREIIEKLNTLFMGIY